MIVVSRSAARRIFDEVQRWVERGLADHGSPHESLVYPLSTLVYRDEPRCPLSLTPLAAIDRVVVDEVAIPPDAIKVFSPANCHFDPALARRENEAFNATIDQLIGSHPRLAVLSKLHSHPFSGRPFLSSGDIEGGVRSPAAVAWRQRRGLSTAILHLVYPSDWPRVTPRRWSLSSEGALARVGRSRVLWKIRTWASDERGQLVDLGDAAVAPQRHKLVRAVRRKPYWATVMGRRWCDRQKGALRQAGYTVSRNLLGRGWRRYLVQHAGRFLLVALPPDLPRQAPQAFWIHDAATNRFERLGLPGWAADAGRLSRLDLVKLAGHYLG